eukprot:gnl/Spiro4/1420_TR762_c0_g1_i1.p1 gnl/Spiro4/1420_TR762_c0_g1~~gnl/Spiro4/1420_TR762_c0_g1_i1.p1  ORF type:complete len:103 (-),score=11.59 gnl/Spiro4/1420_TR762_c0_g1_i1:111-383(-)
MSLPGEMLSSAVMRPPQQPAIQHLGISCDRCGMSPIVGTRFKCGNCPDYDLCEGCENLAEHAAMHVFICVKRPIPPANNCKCRLPFPLTS